MAENNALNIQSAGITVYTGAGIFAGRTITGTANQIDISNGDGVSGNPTISLSSNIYISGISFDSGSNVLSVYTEGTYTPTMVGATIAGAQTYSQQNGYYSKFGSFVSIVNMCLTTANSGTGGVRCSALPYTAYNDGLNVGQATGGVYQVSTTYYSDNFAITPNTTYCIARRAGASVDETVVAAAGGRFSLKYYV